MRFFLFLFLSLTLFGCDGDSSDHDTVTDGRWLRFAGSVGEELARDRAIYAQFINEWVELDPFASFLIRQLGWKMPEEITWEKACLVEELSFQRGQLTHAYYLPADSCDCLASSKGDAQSCRGELLAAGDEFAVSYGENTGNIADLLEREVPVDIDYVTDVWTDRAVYGEPVKLADDNSPVKDIAKYQTASGYEAFALVFANDGRVDVEGCPWQRYLLLAANREQDQIYAAVREFSEGEGTSRQLSMNYFRDTDTCQSEDIQPIVDGELRLDFENPFYWDTEQNGWPQFGLFMGGRK